MKAVSSHTSAAEFLMAMGGGALLLGLVTAFFFGRMEPADVRSRASFARRRVGIWLSAMGLALLIAGAAVYAINNGGPF